MIHNISDITGTGVAIPIVPGGVRTPANWVQISSAKTNVADVRFGDQTTSATSGSRVPSGTVLLVPATGNSESLDLSQCFVLAAAGEIVSIVYGRT